MNWKKLLYCHLAATFLLGTFFFPPTRVYWTMLDTAFFKFLNHTLVDHPKWQLFWALLNHKTTDWIEDFIFLSFCIWAVKQASSGERFKKASQFIFCILLAIPVIYTADRIICRELIDIHRVSPSLIVTPCVRVSHEITWLKIKDSTHSCFPGGHAVTLLFFAASYTFFAGRKLGAYAIGYALFRCLPRMILGAHWLSDIMVGSCTVVLLSLSWMLCTPFHMWLSGHIEWALKNVFSRLKSLKQF